MDSEYLRRNVGRPLTQALAEVCQRKPKDPIDFISQWLYNYKKHEKLEKELFQRDKQYGSPDYYTGTQRQPANFGQISEAKSSSKSILKHVESMGVPQEPVEQAVSQPSVTKSLSKPVMLKQTSSMGPVILKQTSSMGPTPLRSSFVTSEEPVSQPSGITKSRSKPVILKHASSMGPTAPPSEEDPVTSQPSATKSSASKPVILKNASSVGPKLPESEDESDQVQPGKSANEMNQSATFKPQSDSQEMIKKSAIIEKVSQGLIQEGAEVLQKSSSLRKQGSIAEEIKTTTSKMATESAKKLSNVMAAQKDSKVLTEEEEEETSL